MEGGEAGGGNRDKNQIISSLKAEKGEDKQTVRDLQDKAQREGYQKHPDTISPKTSTAH